MAWQLPISGEKNVGKMVLVDEDIYAMFDGKNLFIDTRGYVMYHADGKCQRLHRTIMDCPNGFVVDHLNGDKLDCRRKNLRVCSTLENNRNRHGVKGYYFDKWSGKWVVRHKGKFCGRFATEEEAKKAYQGAKSGQVYQPGTRKFYMLPKNISKQFGKYVVYVGKNNRRFRKAGLDSLSDALVWREKLYQKIKESENVSLER